MIRLRNRMANVTPLDALVILNYYTKARILLLFGLHTKAAHASAGLIIADLEFLTSLYSVEKGKRHIVCRAFLGDNVRFSKVTLVRYVLLARPQRGCSVAYLQRTRPKAVDVSYVRGRGKSLRWSRSRRRVISSVVRIHRLGQVSRWSEVSVP